MKHIKAMTASDILRLIAVVVWIALQRLLRYYPFYNIVLLAVGILILLAYAAGAVSNVKYNKCLHCHKQIRAWRRTPDHCPHCGKATQ